MGRRMHAKPAANDHTIATAIQTVKKTGEKMYPLAPRGMGIATETIRMIAVDHQNAFLTFAGAGSS